MSERVWLWCRRGSTSAVQLVRALREMGINARRWRWPERPPRNPGLIVCWGDPIPEGWDLSKAALKPLNNVPQYGKLYEATYLLGVGVPGPEVLPNAPDYDGRGVGRVWLPRRNNHQKGHDFISPPRVPDYWTQRLELTDEYRVHVFGGRVARIGKKFPRRSFEGRHHPWVRSFETGWGFRFRGEWRRSIPEPVRRWSITAVDALGLDFGAVDVGVGPGGVVVLEVNRAPGLEPRTIQAYAGKIAERVNNVRD